MRTLAQLRESFNTTQTTTWYRPLNVDYSTNNAFYTVNGKKLEVNFYTSDKRVTAISFFVDDDFNVTGGGNQMQIFSLVLQAIREFVAAKKPPTILFSAEKGDTEASSSRIHLYDRMIATMAAKLGYRLESKKALGASKIVAYTLKAT